MHFNRPFTDMFYGDRHGLHDAHDDLLGDEKISFLQGLKWVGDLVDDISSKRGTPTSNSLRRTRVNVPDIGEVTSSESAGESYGLPCMGAFVTNDSLSKMTSVVFDKVITSRGNSSFTSNKPYKLARNMNSGSSR